MTQTNVSEDQIIGQEFLILIFCLKVINVSLKEATDAGVTLKPEAKRQQARRVTDVGGGVLDG